MSSVGGRSVCRPNAVVRGPGRDVVKPCLHLMSSDRLIDTVDCCPWGRGRRAAARSRCRTLPDGRAALYRQRSAAAATHRRWTLVQGVLAPVQFLVFLVSLGLVLRYSRPATAWPRDRLGRGQDPRALHDHDHRRDLGKGGVRPLSVCRRPSSGRTCSACSCWRCTPPISSALFSGALDAARADAAGAGRLCGLRRQRHAVRPEAARRAAAGSRRWPRTRRRWGIADERASPRPRPRARAGCGDRAGPARARPARGVLRPDRHRLAAPQDPGRLLPRGRLAHLRAPDPVRRRRDDLRRAALRHRHHRRARPRRPGRRQRRARPRGRRGCSSAGRTSSCCSWSAPARPR